MTWLWAGLAFVAAAGLAALVYWHLILAEGAYLGPRLVAWTYDLVAHRYDAIKQFDGRSESWFVAAPLLKSLAEVSQPLVLDVATGTGRLPLALLRDRFAGQIIGLDLSLKMLKQACTKLRHSSDQVHWVWQDASHLPFDDGAFDAVTCLESLEFLPRPREALAEMVRVLTAGGVLFVTNRVGREARLLPGRAIPRTQFEQTLAACGLRDVKTWRWQVSYDLALARKEGQARREGRGGAHWLSLLRCSTCGGQLEVIPASLQCPTCGRTHPTQQGIVLLAGGGERGP